MATTMSRTARGSACLVVLAAAAAALLLLDDLRAALEDGS